MSIRWRITLWNTAAFAVVLLGFGVLVYGLLRQTHYEQIDRVLAARYRDIVQDEVEVESKVGVGSIFHVRLPMNGELDSDPMAPTSGPTVMR